MVTIILFYSALHNIAQRTNHSCFRLNNWMQVMLCSSGIYQKVINIEYLQLQKSVQMHPLLSSPVSI